MARRTDPRQAYIYGLVTVLLWSTVATAFKLSLRHLSPPLLLLYASAVSLAVLAAIVVAQGKVALVRRSTGRDLARSLGLGLLNPFVYYLVLFEAYDRLPAQVAQPLNYTWAITLTLLAIPLLHQRIGWRDLAGIGVSYAGVVVISTGGQPLAQRIESPAGVALALASTVIWALYWIAGTRDRRDPVVALTLNFAAGLPFILAYCWLAGELRPPSAAGALGAAYIGVFEMGITFVTWLMALKLAENTARVANLIFLSPFLSLLFIHFVAGEAIRAATIAGLVLIVAGLLVQRRVRPGPAASADLMPRPPVV